MKIVTSCLTCMHTLALPATPGCYRILSASYRTLWHFRPLLAATGYYQPFTCTLWHFRPLLAATGYYQPLTCTLWHFRPLLAATGYHQPLLRHWRICAAVDIVSIDFVFVGSGEEGIAVLALELGVGCVPEGDAAVGGNRRAGASKGCRI